MHASFTENCVELKEKWQNNRTHVLKICQIRNFEKTTKNKVNAQLYLRCYKNKNFIFINTVAPVYRLKAYNCRNNTYLLTTGCLSINDINTPVSHCNTAVI